MYILLNDIIQYSYAPKDLKSPMLYLATKINEILKITLDKERFINSIGIGYTDGSTFTLINNGNQEVINYTDNGLYLLKKPFTASEITIVTDSTFIGRLGAGLGVNIPTAVAKEPSFVSTSEPRRTLCGQTVHGLGGYNYRTLSLDSRYKIDKKIMNEISEGYKYIGKGYPFFIDLSVESYKLPFNKLYAVERNQLNLSFEGGITKYLYSKRWEFEERF
jgi:hypothetical protein